MVTLHIVNTIDTLQNLAKDFNYGERGVLLHLDIACAMISEDRVLVLWSVLTKKTLYSSDKL